MLLQNYTLNYCNNLCCITTHNKNLFVLIRNEFLLSITEELKIMILLCILNNKELFLLRYIFYIYHVYRRELR